MADHPESSDSKGAKRDFSTAILEKKKAANVLVVDEAVNDDKSSLLYTPDTMEKLQLFRGDTILIKAQGFVTVEEVERRLSWSTGRATDALETLLDEGLAMIDDGHRDGKRRYWFPCVFCVFFRCIGGSLMFYSVFSFSNKPRAYFLHPNAGGYDISVPLKRKEPIV